MKIVTHAAQHIGANSGEREGVRSDEVTIQFKSCMWLVELVRGHACQWQTTHL